MYATNSKAKLGQWTYLLSALVIVGLLNLNSAIFVRAATSQYFPETGKTVSGKFLEYWRTNGGLATYGLPISEAQNELDPETGKVFLTQWFERNRFELHPENAGTRYEVLLGLLGKDLKREALQVDPDFAPAEAIFDPAYPQEQQLYFSQTHHNAKPRFARYWQLNGGLTRFGLPLSEEHEELDPTTGRYFKMQWFERARFEYHPENQPPYDILLGLLGSQLKAPRPGSVEFMWKLGDEEQPQIIQNLGVNRWGNIYVVDESPVIRYYNSQGQLLGSWGGPGTGPGQFDSPSAVAFDHTGNTYVADFTQDRIQKFDQDGKFMLAWGSSSASKEAAPAPGNFLHPAALAFDSRDNIYVADSGNDRVQKFDKQGHFLLSWGSSGVADGQFMGPESVVVDSQDNVYVSDFGVPPGKNVPPKDAYIQKFDSQGHFIQKWLTFNPSVGLLKLAIDQQDNLYVLSRNQQSIEQYNKQGQLLLKWDANFTSVALSPQGQVYLGGDIASGSVYSAAHNLSRYAANGEFLGQLSLQPTSTGEHFAAITQLTVDQHGYLYVLDSLDNLIYKFDQAGRFQSKWVIGEGKTSASYFGFLCSIAVDRSDNVYVTDRDKNQIFKYDSQGNLQTQWPVVVGAQANLGAPWRISVDNQDHLFVAVYETLNDRKTNQPKIIKYDSQGHLLGEWGGKGQFDQISAIAVDQAGHVFVADSSKDGGEPRKGRIQKFDSQGNFLTQWRGGDGQNWDLMAPAGLSFNTEGYLYVSDAGLNKIEVFDQQGIYLSSLAGPGRANGQLYSPTSLVLTVDGTLFVADAGNNRVQKFRLR